MKFLILILFAVPAFSETIVVKDVNNVTVDGVPYGCYADAVMNCPSAKDGIKVAMEKHLSDLSVERPLEAEEQLKFVDKQLAITTKAPSPSKADRDNVKAAADAQRAKDASAKVKNSFKSPLLPE